jgi:hypothetical protein
VGLSIPVDTEAKPESLAVAFASTLAAVYVAILAALTVLSHLCQFLTIRFSIYAELCMGISATILAAFVFYSLKWLKRRRVEGWWSLLAILLVGAVGAMLALGMHRVGRISPDEYYYASNPVYFTQHPNESLSFESRLFYDRSEIRSAAFFTAGAYEYVEAAAAYILGVRFATVYYLIGAAVTGFLIPTSLFLAIYRLTGRVRNSVVGAFVAMAIILLMGETSWAPGANAFLRAFEGKAFLQFAGVPLLVAYSISYLRHPRASAWWCLFALCTALAGMSTTSFALAVLLGINLLGAYWIAFRANGQAFRDVSRSAWKYLAAFSYLALWAVLVARMDGIQTAEFLNADYPASFGAYIQGFLYSPYPMTPVLLVAGCTLALVAAEGMVRKFLTAWIGLAVLIALNPVSAGLLLSFLRGVYYRLLYLLPFPLCWGLAAAFLLGRIAALGRNAERVAIAVLCLAAVLLPWIVPVSVFRLPLYGWGNTLFGEDLRKADQIVGATPKGVMLAPYPLSGGIAMLDSERPQMLTRPDLMDFYLRQQGQDEEAMLRHGSQLALDGSPKDAAALGELLLADGEIRSVVFVRGNYLRMQQLADPLLEAAGFTRVDQNIPGIEVFAR